MHRLLWIIFVLALLPVSPATTQTNTERDQQVWAFYLSFWAGPNTWPFEILQDTSVNGFYNTKMPGIAALHIQQAQATGIDAFVVSWWGVDETVTTTPALLNLLDRAEERDFQIGAVVDMFPQEFYPDQDSVERSLQWLLDVAVPHPAYLHYQGKPVIVFAFQDRPGFDAAYWRDLRARLDPNHQTWWLAEGLSACCLYGGAMDGMYAFNMAWANGNRDYYIAERNVVQAREGALYIPSISPGWDEAVIADLTDRPNPTSPRNRNNGTFLADAWAGALQADPDIVMVVSWNEFIENSHIEPSAIYGTQSLDTLRPLISAWKGTDPPAVLQAQMAYVIVTDYMAAIYAEARHDAAIIGYAPPDQPYTMMDEDNGFYAVALPGGGMGWLHYTALYIQPARVD